MLQRRQQQFLLLQQLQKQQQQAAAISQFPSNIDTHLRPPGITHRPIQLKTVPNAPHQQQQQQQHQLTQQQHQHQQQNLQQQQQQLQHKVIRPGNQLNFQMACQDAWRVCYPDFKLPFSSLEDAYERLLPYHVIADYEAEEDDRFLGSNWSGSFSFPTVGSQHCSQRCRVHFHL